MSNIPSYPLASRAKRANGVEDVYVDLSGVSLRGDDERAFKTCFLGYEFVERFDFSDRR